MIFDTHAHYDDEKFDADREALLSSMEGQGIGRIINVSANLAGSHISEIGVLYFRLCGRSGGA